jgi:hypothetical protein
MRRSLRVSISCTVSAALLATSLAHAEPPRAITLEHDGVPGIWMPEDMSRAMLADVEELRVRRTELELCKKRSTVQLERTKQLDAALAAARKSAATSQAQIDAAVRGREQAERDLDGWLAGKPWLWGVLGAVIGAVTTGVIVKYTQ